MIDDDGNNLVLILLSNFTLDEYSITELKYIIEKKGCQVDITNKSKMNAVGLAMNMTMPVLQTHRMVNNVTQPISKMERIEIRDKNVTMYHQLL